MLFIYYYLFKRIDDDTPFVKETGIDSFTWFVVGSILRIFTVILFIHLMSCFTLLLKSDMVTIYTNSNSNFIYSTIFTFLYVFGPFVTPLVIFWSKAYIKFYCYTFMIFLVNLLSHVRRHHFSIITCSFFLCLVCILVIGMCFQLNTFFEYLSNDWFWDVIVLIICFIIRFGFSVLSWDCLEDFLDDMYDNNIFPQYIYSMGFSKKKADYYVSEYKTFVSIFRNIIVFLGSVGGFVVLFIFMRYFPFYSL